MLNTVTLNQRSGNNRTYVSDKGLIGVVVCTDPNLYVTTGYYIRTDRNYPNHVVTKAYRTAKQAALAAYKSI
jgi:hypothetical protein